MFSFLIFFDHFLMEGLLHYIPHWFILSLHLLLVCAFTWVLVPSNILSGFPVSCGSQVNTVQGSFQHKCSQESSFNAFNVVVAAFPKIFLRSHHPWTFTIHIFITGDSWKVIIIVRTCIWYEFIVSEETFLLRPSSYRYYAHWFLGLKYSLWFTRPRTTRLLVEAQGPIHDLGP